MTIVNVNSISGINSITAESNSLNFYDSAGRTLSIGASVSGNITGNVTGNLTGNINSSGISTVTTLNATSIVGVTTAGITTAYVTTLNDGPLSGARNIIINGSMVINQRGFTGAAGTTTSDSYVTDRFLIQYNHDGAVSTGQTGMGTTTGGNAYADGFQNALLFNVTTADASLAAGQFQVIEQRVEGFNLQGIKKGTANALPVTLSFWCRSTTTGNYIVELYDNDNVRQVSQAYTINAANTWEKKTLTLPADTTGAFDNDNGRSLNVYWWLGAGSNYSSGTLNTSWAAVTNANRAVGQTNLLASAGNNFWLTGVQLEVGSVATPFERRSYGQELALCQRYYISSSKTYYLCGFGNAPATNVLTTITFPVFMRATPTIKVGSTSDGTGFSLQDSTLDAFTYVAVQNATTSAARFVGYTASIEL